MDNYFDNISEELRNYFNVLSDETPDFLVSYVNTPAMRKQENISVSCGIYYTGLYDLKWYSSLDHSVAVALIIWHFTHDKVQTLAGLFHDIATPAFKHAIDFMNGDYEKQESTEELTEKMITESKEIMELLEKNSIDVKDICDYHIYPIADNDTPQLSSDRLEYTLSNGFGVRLDLWDLSEIKKVYNDIEIQKNEDGIAEIGFKHIDVAEYFIENMSKLSSSYIDDGTRFSMQFVADMLKTINENGLIETQDLYDKSEKEIIDIIENCNIPYIRKNYDLWKNAKCIKYIEAPSDDDEKYFTKVEKAKIRYIDPLVRCEDGFKRASEVSGNAKFILDNTKNHKISNSYMCIE